MENPAIKRIRERHGETCKDGKLDVIVIRGVIDGAVKVTSCNVCDLYTVEKVGEGDV